MVDFKVGDRVRKVEGTMAGSIGVVTAQNAQFGWAEVDYGNGSIWDEDSSGLEAVSSLFADRVEATLGALGEMLVAKNAAYGNSALDPVRVFSSGSAAESLAQRVDDKLSRIARGSEFPGDDTVDDLIGYLVLYKLAREDEK